jgi:CheY-like chemotaxis protein
MNALPPGWITAVDARVVCKTAKDLNALQNDLPCVLVVEDEFLIRMMISDYLAECGFKVMDVSNADDAIELLEGTASPFDVVFSDVNMPGKTDGFGLARWIWANRPETAVLLASGVVTKSGAAAESVSSDCFVEKPYDVRRVAEQIQHLAHAAH